MGARRQWFLLNILKVFDLLVMTVVYLLAAVPVAHGREGISLTEFLSMRIKVENFFLFLAIMGAWHILFASLGVYQSQRLSSLKNELLCVIRATSACTLCVGVAALLFTIRMVRPEFLVAFWLLTTATLVLSRFVLRSLLESIRRRGRNLRHILVVGTNLRAIQFAQKIEATIESGYRIIGFVDDPWSGQHEFQSTPYRLVCDLRTSQSFFGRPSWTKS